MKKVLLFLAVFALAINTQAQVKTPSWSDAPSVVSATLGYTSLDYQFSSSMIEVGADASWKYLYIGGSVAFGSKDDVTEVASNIKIGGALPIPMQNGKYIIINPYIVISSTDYKYGGYTESDLGLGPGLKVNYVLPSNWVVGAFFQQPYSTEDQSQNTMNTTFGLSLGYKF